MREENKRAFPIGDKIMSDKKFDDLIYGYLLLISDSYKDSEVRYVTKRTFIKKDVAKVLNINFRTFQRKFDYLVKSGYVVNKEETYDLPKISEDNSYISSEVLKVLLEESSKNIIKVYSYLEKLKKSMEDQVSVTKSNLLIKLGFKIRTKEVDELGNIIFSASKSQKDWDQINMILNCLESRLNLIKCYKVRERFKRGYVEKLHFEVNTKIIL